METEKKRRCYLVLADRYDKERGYPVGIVTEDEPWYHLTGDLDYATNPAARQPYFWGHDLDAANKIAAEENAKMGISEEEAFKIVTSSMFPKKGRKRK